MLKPLFVVLACGTTLAAQAQPSPSEPTSIPQPELIVGDTWVYDRTFEQGTNTFTQKRIDLRINRIRSDSMMVGIKEDGAPADFEDHITGLDWSQRRLVDGKETVTGRPLAFPMTVGKTWTADYVDPRVYGLQRWARFQTTYKAVGWEDVETPAGKFHALKVEANTSVEARMDAAASAVGGGVVTGASGTSFSHVEKSPARTVHATEYEEFYYVPAVKYWVKMLSEQYDENSTRAHRNTEILVSFKGS